MTELLEQTIQQTNKVFEPGKLQVPEPTGDWKEKLNVYADASLLAQRRSLVFDLRCWQAEQMGFKQLQLVDTVKMLMGEAHTHHKKIDNEKHSFEWIYDHHNDTEKEGADCTWTTEPHQYWRSERGERWFLPPFNKVEKWRCQYGTIARLKLRVPYGIALRMVECKHSKIFNAFGCVAPIDAFLTEKEMDPMILAEIWEMPNENSGGKCAYFFMAQWK